ncbi:permease, partial [Candidatus Micrarchaeota archaeon]|nr:permease [Candidatus Micrarchaeota archaeon]
MGVLEDFASWFVYGVLGMAESDQLAESLNFFIYDTLKVLILLAVMVFLVSILRTYITRNRIKKILGKKKEGIGNVLAALLGVPTPFCSCSAVPLFIGFVDAGVPLGVTFSFLISAPMVNEIAIALLLGLVGVKITFLYVAAGLTVSIAGGILIGRMGLEKEVKKISGKGFRTRNGRMNLPERIEFAKGETGRITKRVAPYVLLGIAVGALIHGFVPVGFLADIAGPGNPLAVPVAVLIGIPLYSNAAGTIPIVSALMDKGMALGTALALMMSITALSLPE